MSATRSLSVNPNQKIFEVSIRRRFARGGVVSNEAVFIVAGMPFLDHVWQRTALLVTPGIFLIPWSIPDLMLARDASPGNIRAPHS